MKAWLRRHAPVLLLYAALAGLMLVLREKTSGFARPQALLGLLSVGLLASLLAADSRSRRIARQRFADDDLLRRMGALELAAPLRLRGALLIAGVALLMVAAARPKGGLAAQDLTGEGYDLYVCLDVSNSMRTRDAAGLSRLEMAKQILSEYLEAQAGNRIGLIGFAGSAHVMCPFTLDTTTLISFLEDMDYSSVAKQGTALGEALRVALERFDSKEPGGQAILLLSDGEDQGSKPLEQAAEARRRGVIVHTVGLGTAAGDVVPLGVDLWGNPYVKQHGGKEVVSKLDEATLRKIAETTGGRYFLAQSAEELRAILAALDRLPTKVTGSRRLELREDLYAWYVFPALLLLAVEPLVRLRPRRREVG